MRRLHAFVIAGIGAVAFTAAAHAADPREMVMPRYEPPALSAVEFASGWYIRGDAGYRVNRLQGIDSPVPVTSTFYDKTYTFGGGFGHKWNWFRADLTLDYAVRRPIEGATALAGTSYTASIDTLTTLANVYLDLGNWGGFSPYVGAGVGPSRLNISNFRNSPAATMVTPSETWRISWALTAGVSYQITPSIALDVGYRHLNLGDAFSGNDTTGRVTYKGLSANEIRIGFRLLID